MGSIRPCEVADPSKSESRISTFRGVPGIYPPFWGWQNTPKTQGTPLLGGFLTTKYPGYPPRGGGSTMPGGGYLHDMSCNHPGLVNNPWDLDPGCSGTSIQDLPRIFRKSLRKPPESTFSRFPVIRVILDDKMTKK